MVMRRLFMTYAICNVRLKGTIQKVGTENKWVLLGEFLCCGDGGRVTGTLLLGWWVWCLFTKSTINGRRTANYRVVAQALFLAPSKDIYLARRNKKGAKERCLKQRGDGRR